MRTFLWGNVGEKGSHLVKWETVKKLRTEGGLGIGNIRKKNESLMGKWLWRFAKEKDELWRKVIESRYGTDMGGWTSGSGKKITARSPWKGISRVRKKFLENTIYKLGNGGRIRFWKDHFIDDANFQVRFPKIYGITNKPNAFVCEFVQETTAENISWNLHLRRGLREEEIQELEEMLGVLERVKPVPILEDRWTWKLDKSTIFSCKSFFNGLLKQNSQETFDFEGRIWKAEVPQRIKFMVWTVIINKVNTSDILQRKQPYRCISPSRCELCSTQAETVNHLFIHCEFAQNMWCSLLRKMQLQWVCPESVRALWEIEFVDSKQKSKKCVWELAKVAVLWEIWRERNARIFDNKERNISDIFDNTIHDIAMWASNHNVLSKFSYLEWVRDWNVIFEM